MPCLIMDDLLHLVVCGRMILQEISHSVQGGNIRHVQFVCTLLWLRMCINRSQILCMILEKLSYIGY